MSLLMDALRKAEAAKRQAAQTQEADKRRELQTNDAEPLAVENLRGLEESLESDRPMISSVEAPEELEFELDPVALSTVASEGSADVDDSYDFDFEIDESFALDKNSTVTNEAVDSSESSDIAKNELEQINFTEDEPAKQENHEFIEKNLDSLHSDDFEGIATQETQEDLKTEESESSVETTAIDDDYDAYDATESDEVKKQPSESGATSLGLTLEERAPDVERPSIIGADLEIPDESTSGQHQASDSEVKNEAEPSAPIRALRNDENTNEVSDKAIDAATPPKLSKAADSRFAEESRNRKSARAVFNAKLKGKGNGTRKKLIAAAAVIALIPLVGGGYLLLDFMGFMPSATQYNIPPANVADNGAYEATLENGLVQEDVLPDLSPEPIVATQQAQEIVVEPSLPVFVQEVAQVLDTSALTQSPVVVEMEAIVPELPRATQQNIASSEALQESTSTQSTPAETSQLGVQTEVLAEVQAEMQEPAPINITRTDNSERVDPQLTQAYTSYRANDFIGARARYQQVLREKPNNRDAMLGIAAAAIQLGDTASARESYIKLLQLDSRDVHARAGLLETMPAGDPVQLESELRGLFEAHPEVAQLSFALGNHFASQRRWSEAQQSYYDALLSAKANGNGPVNPDYAFNLAVSLERLNQLRPAYTFYREALEQSEFLTPGFDIRVLRERLDALERLQP